MLGTVSIHNSELKGLNAWGKKDKVNTQISAVRGGMC